MPAMSSTMEKGGIVNWKFKPGEKFETGDVLLEVDTEKAQIDVEVQDNGQMVKILVNDGAKDVSVGTPIAYIADPDDDISELTILKGNIQASHYKTNQSSHDASKSNIFDLNKKEVTNVTTTTVTEGSSIKILPSAALLCSQNNISIQEARNKIQGSGLCGRILKGDFVAYLNKIPRESVDKISKYMEKNSKLDLSNIEIQKATSSNVKNIENDKTRETVTVEEPTMDIITPTPILFTENLIISIADGVTLDELRLSMKKFIQEAYQYSHKPPVSTSQYFGPIF